VKKLILLILLNFTVFFNSYSLESLSLEESLINAAKKGELETIKELINSGVNIRYKDQRGLNALHYAAINNKANIIELLVLSGIHINSTFHHGFGALWQTPLTIAAKENNIDVVRALLDIYNKKVDLTNKSNVELIENEKRQALRYAIENNNFEFVRFLLEPSANGEKMEVNYVWEDGQTLLMHAVARDKIDIVGLLIESGADVNYQSREGITALMVAVSEGLYDRAELLINAGADVNLKTSYRSRYPGSTALLAAAIVGSGTKFIELLIANGADINAQDDKGMTAIMYSVTKKHLIRLTRFLIEKSANLLLKNKDGFTAYDLARQLLDSGIGSSTVSAQAKDKAKAVVDLLETETKKAVEAKVLSEERMEAEAKAEAEAEKLRNFSYSPFGILKKDF
jgi:ankyrin repeat protein